MTDTDGFNGYDMPNWKSLFLDSKKPGRSVNDAMVLLRCHPETRGRLRYDTFAKQVIAWDWLPWQAGGLSFPRPVEDCDGMLATAWLEQQGMSKIGAATVKDCIISVARQKSFNPLIDWLQSLEWDGQERIEKWLSYYLGAEPTDYLLTVGPKFLISAVARALQPGCKVDTMLILEGPQGQFKSTAARLLFGAEWYTDDLADFHNKDSTLQMQGKWGIEMSELSSMSRAEANRTKAILSRQVDRFRAPYDRFVMEHPRQCVFIGTTNPADGYFKDPTGSRRFWPVTCGTIDREALVNDRAQLWAEAVHCFERRDRWWLENGEVDAAKAEQSQREESDPWDREVLAAIRDRNEITTHEILTVAIGLSVKDLTRADEMRVAALLSRLDWTRRRPMVNGVRQWTWYCPTSTAKNAWGRAEGGAGDFS